MTDVPSLALSLKMPKEQDLHLLRVYREETFHTWLVIYNISSSEYKVLKRLDWSFDQCAKLDYNHNVTHREHKWSNLNITANEQETIPNSVFDDLPSNQDKRQMSYFKPEAHLFPNFTPVASLP